MKIISLPSKEQKELSNIAKIILNQAYSDYSAFKFLSKGSFSSVFSFELKGKLLVIKLQFQGNYDFEINKYKFLSDSLLPLPKTLKKGKVGDYAFLITSHCAGHKPEKYEDLLEILPAFVQCISHLHCHALPLSRPDIVDQQIKTWPEIFTQYIGLHGYWLETYRTSPYGDQSLIKQIFQYLFKQAPLFENLLFPIHGDLNRSNLFIHEQKVSGIIDFSEYQYGDFLYDYSWLLMHCSSQTLLTTIQSLYSQLQALGLPLENYKERLLACLCHRALIDISYFTIQKPQSQKVALLKENILLALKHVPGLAL